MTAVHELKLPTELAVRRVLEDVLDRDVTVSHAGGPALENGEGLLAVYRDDDGAVRAVAGWHPSLIIAAGGALGLLPPGFVGELVDEGLVRADLADNVLELCNVLVAAFGREDVPHLRLAEHHRPASGADPDLRALATRHSDRLDLTVAISGYPAGTLTLAVV